MLHVSIKGTVTETRLKHASKEAAAAACRRPLSSSCSWALAALLSAASARCIASSKRFSTAEVALQHSSCYPSRAMLAQQDAYAANATGRHVKSLAAIPGRVRDISPSRASTGLQGHTHWLHVCRHPPLKRPAGQPARAPGQRRQPPAHSQPARLRPRRPAPLPRPLQAPPGRPALPVQPPAVRPQAPVAAPGSCRVTSLFVSAADLTDNDHFEAFSPSQ